MKAKTKKQLAIAQQYCFDLIVANIDVCALYDNEQKLIRL